MAYIDVEKLYSDRLRKGKTAMEFWACEIQSSKVVKSGHEPIHVLHTTFSNKKIWNFVLGCLYSIHNRGYIGYFEKKNLTFPIFVTQKRTGGYTGSSFDIIKQQIIDEELKKKSSRKEEEIPKVVISKEGFVWKLEKDMRIIGHREYFNEQIRFYKEDYIWKILVCENRNKSKIIEIDEEKKEETPDTDYIEICEKSIEQNKEDIKFYKNELERLAYDTFENAVKRLI